MHLASAVCRAALPKPDSRYSTRGLLCRLPQSLKQTSKQMVASRDKLYLMWSVVDLHSLCKSMREAFP